MNACVDSINSEARFVKVCVNSLFKTDRAFLIKFYKNDLSNVYGCEITLFCEIMPVTKSYFIPKVGLNPCSVLKMSENKVKLMHSVYSFFLEFFRI